MSDGSGKTPVNLRLSAEALRLVDLLKDQKGVTRTAVIEMAVRDFAKRQLEPQPDTTN